MKKYFYTKLIDETGKEIKTDDPCNIIRTKKKLLYIKVEENPPLCLCDLCINKDICTTQWNTIKSTVIFTTDEIEPELIKTVPIWKQIMSYHQLFYEISCKNFLEVNNYETIFEDR